MLSTMPFEPDLARYFERINCRCPSWPDLAGLNAIVLAHVCSIPFESIDVLLGRPIDLDPARVEHKLLVERRGGYCFEQNTLLLRVLQALGYTVSPIAARVRLGNARSEVTAKTHVFLRVEMDGESWLVDVGVGGFSLTSAIRLRLDEPQETSHEPRRIQAEGTWRGLELRSPDARLFHQVHFEDAWHDICDFTLAPMHDIDRELGNWYTSAHPRSHFKDRLMVSRATPDGRKALLNRRFTHRQKGRATIAYKVESPTELNALLEREFGIVVPDAARIECAGLEW
jgi:N-hydroxyarylamine O-acetyltransferase